MLLLASHSPKLAAYHQPPTPYSAQYHPAGPAQISQRQLFDHTGLRLDKGGDDVYSRYEAYGESAGPSAQTHRSIRAEGPNPPPFPRGPVVEAIPPPRPKVAYEAPVFRTFQERKRAKDMAIRAGSSSDSHGPSPAESRASVAHSTPPPLVSPHTSSCVLNSTQAPQPPPRAQTSLSRPLPQPAIRSHSPQSSAVPVQSPVEATLERSDTISSIKSLDRMGFSSEKRPLPRPPVGVNSSKSLDRGLPTTSLRRKQQPSIVNEEENEDGTSEGLSPIDLGSPGASRSPSLTGRSAVTVSTHIVSPLNKPPSIVEPLVGPAAPVLDVGVPTFSFSDSEVHSGQPRDRAPSPGIGFSELPIISVSSEDTPSAPVPTISVPEVTSISTPSRISSTSAILCTGCGEPIVGRIVNAMHQRWHPQCFICDACGELLEHVSSYEFEGRAYCHLDYHDVSLGRIKP